MALATAEKKEMQMQLFKISSEIAGSIHCYTLRATLHGEFWKEIERVI